VVAADELITVADRIMHCFVYRISASLIALWLCVVAAVFGQDLPASTVEHGAFAFPDMAGTRLLVTSMLSQPESLKTAICGGKVRGPVVFERRQSERPGGTSRQTPRNFDYLAGSVFRFTSGKLDETDTCFLATGSLLADATVLPIVGRGDAAACASRMGRRLASLRGRPVVNCWVLAGLEENGQIVLAEFARRGKEALASAVLMEGDRSVFADFTAEYRGEGQDVWRVDDEGVLSPADFNVMFVLERGAFRALAINWSGAEGANLSLFVADRQGRFAAVIKDYWYQASM
jgi:hypothetical protein